MKKIKEKIKEFKEKIKEKIKEFKAKEKKEKTKKIIDIVFLGVLIIILAILMMGYFVSRENKNKTAGAMVSNSPELIQVMYKTYNNDNVDRGIYTLGYYDFDTPGTEIREFGVNYMEILNNGQWEKVKGIEEKRDGYNVSVKFKTENGVVLNKISMFTVPITVSGPNWSTRVNCRVRAEVFEEIRVKWDGVINYVGGRVQMYTEYALPRILMLYMNVNPFDIEETTNYPNLFFESGYNTGYNTGYNKGFGEGSSKTFNPIGMIIKPVAQLFSIKMFGEFAIGDFFTVAMFVSVAIIFLKIFAGG